jgi:transcriptional regulator GlxA family with amidase domain
LDDPRRESEFQIHNQPKTYWCSQKTERLLLTSKKSFESNEDMLKRNELLGLLLEHLVRDSAGTNPHGRGITKPTQQELARRLTLAMDYLHGNWNKDVDLDELAMVCMLSKYHLIRSFKNHFGLTPHQYLMEIRLDVAQRELSGSDTPIRQIGLDIGFKEPNAFTKAFKKRFGHPPSQQRLQLSNFG